MSSLDTREVDRDSMLLVADMFVGAEPPVKIKVRNLSAGGMMGEGAVAVSTGQTVRIDIRNIGLVSGTVAWVRAPRFGVSFDDAIDPRVARRTVFGGDREAPIYARAAVAAPRHDGWNGKLRRI